MALRLTALTTHDLSGNSVSSAGVNGDGFDDTDWGYLPIPTAVMMLRELCCVWLSGGFSANLNLSTQRQQWL